MLAVNEAQRAGYDEKSATVSLGLPTEWLCSTCRPTILHPVGIPPSPDVVAARAVADCPSATEHLGGRQKNRDASRKR